jgi:acetolactate synthase I/II/III large subunit
MMRVADYIAQTLAKRGVRDVFMVTGGGAMHLNDALGRCRDLRVLCCHHEQACAMAAESYYRLSGRMAAVNVTSGPGGTNAITGVYGAFVDSLAMVVISGQVKYETLVRSTGLPLRQLGDQELDIIPMVRHVTKYAEMVVDRQTIRYHLEKALHLATSGRPGPVWLDVPLNVQGASIDPETLAGYDSAEDDQVLPLADQAAVAEKILQKLAAAKRPVMMLGSGVRLAGMRERVLSLSSALGIPVVTAWNAHDLMPDDHPCYSGRPGTIGNRPGNFAVQNSDMLLVLGCRLNIRQVSYNWSNFAERAFKIVVDVDPTELRKPTIKPDMPIHANLREFVPALEAAAGGWTRRHDAWRNWCRERVNRYPACLPEYRDRPGKINPYCFADRLMDLLPDDAIVVTGDGTACVATFQAARLRGTQRLFTNSGCASMGYDLPAAIGACVAAGGRRVVCLAGDGSIQMNLQELQTIVTRRLPIHVVVLNNAGYHSIRQTQTTYFPDGLIGFDAATGVDYVPFEGLARAFSLPFRRCESLVEMDRALLDTFRCDGPSMCEAVLDPSQPFAPRVSSRKLEDGTMVSAPLDDMFPFLDREELARNRVSEGL